MLYCRNYRTTTTYKIQLYIQHSGGVSKIIYTDLQTSNILVLVVRSAENLCYDDTLSLLFLSYFSLSLFLSFNLYLHLPELFSFRTKIVFHHSTHSNSSYSLSLILYEVRGTRYFIILILLILQCRNFLKNCSSFYFQIVFLHSNILLLLCISM